MYIECERNTLRHVSPPYCVLFFSDLGSYNILSYVHDWEQAELSFLRSNIFLNSLRILYNTLNLSYSPPNSS